MFADNFAQAKQYLARVVAWADTDELTAFVNVHTTFQGQNYDKPIWTGRAVTSVAEAISYIQWVLQDQNTRDIYVCLSTQRTAEAKTNKIGGTYYKPIRSQQNAVALKSLFLDIDCKGEGYANLNDAAVALAAIETRRR
jgi:hypothetical protein